MSKLVCPYCGKEFSALRQHCTKKHRLDWESQVLVNYPNLKSSSDERIKKYSDHMKKMNQDPDFNSKKVQWTEKKAESARKNLEKINNDPVLRKELNQKASERMSKWNSSEEGRRVRSETMLRYHREHPEAGQRCCFRGKRCNVKLDDNRVVQVRSLLEMRVVQELRRHFNVFIEYEPFGVQYEGPDSLVHTYIPDLLVDGCLVLEVKPSCKVDSLINQLKKESILNKGLMFDFITSPQDLYNNNYLVQRLSKV